MFINKDPAERGGKKAEGEERNEDNDLTEREREGSELLK